jgi:hypothetical protein
MKRHATVVFVRDFCRDFLVNDLEEDIVDHDGNLRPVGNRKSICTVYGVGRALTEQGSRFIPCPGS